MKLTAHCIIKNEDIWIRFAINSIIDLIDQIFVFDTGSSDKTVEIIKSIKSPKIIFEEKGSIDRVGLVKLRQEQLDRTKTPWFLILDGDEIWPKVQLEKLFIEAEKKQDKIIAVVNKTRNCLGDVYHFLPDEAGGYKIGEKVGNFNIRLIKKTKNLKISGKYPLEVYSDENGVVQDQVGKLLFSESWYLHTTYLKRSSADQSKTSGSFGRKKIWEKGVLMERKELPEVLRESGELLRKRSLWYEGMAAVSSPLLKLKRK